MNSENQELIGICSIYNHRTTSRFKFRSVGEGYWILKLTDALKEFYRNQRQEDITPGKEAVSASEEDIARRSITISDSEEYITLGKEVVSASGHTIR